MRQRDRVSDPNGGEDHGDRRRGATELNLLVDDPLNQHKRRFAPAAARSYIDLASDRQTHHRSRHYRNHCESGEQSSRREGHHEIVAACATVSGG